MTIIKKTVTESELDLIEASARCCYRASYTSLSQVGKNLIKSNGEPASQRLPELSHQKKLGILNESSLT